jgi:hypothetical protein
MFGCDGIALLNRHHRALPISSSETGLSEPHIVTWLLSVDRNGVTKRRDSIGEST